MKTESKSEAPKVLPEGKSVPLQAAAPRQQEHPFHIVPQPPVPGQTAWSIVPW